jgi:hypothetical protein
VDLESSEQYRQQMAAIGVAAIGYWTEAMGIHPDYDTVPLRDVARLYAKYDALHQLQAAGQLVDGWLDSGEHRPDPGQEVWAAILHKPTNAPPEYSVSPAVFEYGCFRDANSDNSLYWPTHWKPRRRPEPPALPAE